MTQSRPSLVTGLMLGAFLALGVDTLVVVGALWYVGRLSDAVAGGLSVVVVAVFSAWILGRWIRIRWGNLSGSTDDERPEADGQRDPVDRLKQRYAEGEISDAEFEARLDGLLDADHRVESDENLAERQYERSGRSE